MDKLDLANCVFGSNNVYSCALGGRILYFLYHIFYCFAEQFLLLDPKQYNFMSFGNVHVPNMDEKQEFKNTLVSCIVFRLVVKLVVSPKFKFLWLGTLGFNAEIVSTNLTIVYLLCSFSLGHFLINVKAKSDNPSRRQLQGSDEAPSFTARKQITFAPVYAVDSVLNGIE